jgi:hypothetical protein
MLIAQYVYVKRKQQLCYMHRERKELEKLEKISLFGLLQLLKKSEKNSTLRMIFLVCIVG